MSLFLFNSASISNVHRIEKSRIGAISILVVLLQCVFFMVLSVQSHASSKQVTFVTSSNSYVEQDLIRRIKTNATALVDGQHRLSYRVVQGNSQPSRLRQQLRSLQQGSSDVVIATGFVASQQLANLRAYRKPSIATVIMDERLQRVPRSLTGRSGINNFTYVKPRFDIAADLRMLSRIYPFKKVGIVVDRSLTSQKALITQGFKGYTAKPFELFFVDHTNYVDEVKRMANHVDAVYVLPLFTFNDASIDAFFKQVTQHKLPSFALSGRAYTQAGALASQSPSDYAEIQARRIAIDIMKIFDGANAAALPVNLPRVDNDFVINMQTAQAIGVYPNFSVLQKADVLNALAASATAESMDVFTALEKALANNLDIQKLRNQVSLSELDISEAKRAFLPNLEVNLIGRKVDNAFRLVQGAGATTQLNAKATQIVFADQAIALYKARKLGLNANLEGLKRTEYDVIFQVLSGYVRHATAKRQVAIQRTNTQLTRKNLEVARRKATIGAAGKLDVHRLESELAINQANLSQAMAQFRQSGYALKKVLNVDINADIAFTEIDNPLKLLSISDLRLIKDLDNKKKVARFTDYLLSIALSQRPAVIQYQQRLEAENLMAKAERRKWFMPVISVSANANKELNRFDKVDGAAKRLLQPEWDVNLVANIPLFERLHATDKKKTAANIMKLTIERDDLVRSIDQGLRTDMETAIASYTQMELYKKAAASAEKNFNIVSKYYQHGRVTITNLIDAQNTVLRSRLNVVNAQQQFFIDYLKVEQDSGFYYFLADKEKQDAFVMGFLNFLQQPESAATHAASQRAIEQ